MKNAVTIGSFLWAMTICAVTWSPMAFAQAPTLDWVQTFGNDGANQHDEFHDMAVDSEGNIYVTATIMNANSTNPWPAPSYGSIDIIIMKLDAEGNTVWVKQIGGPNNDGGRTFPFYTLFKTWITLVKNEYLVVSGVAGRNCDLDPGSEEFLTANGPSDYQPFVLRMDTSGSFIWGKTWDVGGASLNYLMTVDTAGGIYLANQFSGDSVDVDPSPLSEVWLAQTDYPDDRTNYLVKLSPEGEFEWFGVLPIHTYVMGQAPNGASGEYYPSPLIPFQDGILISNCFDGVKNITLPYDTVQLISQSWCEPYFAAIGPEGMLNWYGQFGGDSMQCSIMSMTTDDLENIYVYGTFGLPSLSVDVDPGLGIQLEDMDGSFYLKLNSDGNLTWMTPFSGTQAFIYDMEIYGSCIYSFGAFLGALSVETTVGEIDMVAPNTMNGFMLISDTAGFNVWAGQFQSNEFSDRINWARISNHVQNGFAIGFTLPISDQTDIDPGPIQNTVASTGGYDFFVEHLSYAPVTVSDETRTILPIEVYPNPTDGKVYVAVDGSDTFWYVIYSAEGQIVDEDILPSSRCIVLPETLHSGLYLLKLCSDNVRQTMKIILK